MTSGSRSLRHDGVRLMGVPHPERHKLAVHAVAGFVVSHAKRSARRSDQWKGEKGPDLFVPLLWSKQRMWAARSA